MSPRSVSRGSPDYPKRFDGLGSSAPSRVFFRGPSWSPEPRAVGIVGSRRASEGGRAFARGLARDLVESGIAVVSGGALGIDRAAHEGALDAKGRTCVVLPTPVTDPAPRSHRGLFEAVLRSGGTLLSEYEFILGKHTFAERNRLIAALSDAVVIVEAGARSGTQYTAEAALGLARPLFCKRWPNADPRGAGARALSGARGFDLAKEIVDYFERPDVGDGPAPSESEDRGLIWNALEEPKSLDALVRSLSLTPAELSRQLLEAELSGRIERAGGRWRRVARLR